MSGEERRTTARDPAALGPLEPSQGQPEQGVGGRQPGSPPAHGGGGYRDICDVQNFARAANVAPLRDPRLDELARMGLPCHWLSVAEAIGVDAFLIMWRTLDGAQALHDAHGSGLRVRLRRYDSYLRFQRNRYIEGLHAAGLNSEQIRRHVAANIGEDLSERHIDRLRKAG